MYFTFCKAKRFFLLMKGRRTFCTLIFPSRAVNLHAKFVHCLIQTYYLTAVKAGIMLVTVVKVQSDSLPGWPRLVISFTQWSNTGQMCSVANDAQGSTQLRVIVIGLKLHVLRKLYTSLSNSSFLKICTFLEV